MMASTLDVAAQNQGASMVKLAVFRPKVLPGKAKFPLFKACHVRRQANASQPAGRWGDGEKNGAPG